MIHLRGVVVAGAAAIDIMYKVQMLVTGYKPYPKFKKTRPIFTIPAQELARWRTGLAITINNVGYRVESVKIVRDVITACVGVEYIDNGPRGLTVAPI